MAQAASLEATPEAKLSSQKICDACGEQIHSRAEICPKCGVRQRRPVSKAVLLLLTFFGGGLGAHKFYLGKYWQGALYLLFFWTGIPGLVALIEFIIYAFTSSERLKAPAKTISASRHPKRCASQCRGAPIPTRDLTVCPTSRCGPMETRITPVP